MIARVLYTVAGTAFVVLAIAHLVFYAGSSESRDYMMLALLSFILANQQPTP